MDRIGIGLAGLGTVGAGVYRHLIQNRAIISETAWTAIICPSGRRKKPGKENARFRLLQRQSPGIGEELIDDPEGQYPRRIDGRD